jgi:hypothetical protein
MNVFIPTWLIECSKMLLMFALGAVAWAAWSALKKDIFGG